MCSAKRANYVYKNERLRKTAIVGKQRKFYPQILFDTATAQNRQLIIKLGNPTGILNYCWIQTPVTHFSYIVSQYGAYSQLIRSQFMTVYIYPTSRITLL